MKYVIYKLKCSHLFLRCVIGCPNKVNVVTIGLGVRLVVNIDTTSLLQFTVQ